MSENQLSVNKEVVRRHLEEAVNAHRPQLWDEIMAEDVVVHHPLLGTSTGRAGYRLGVEGLWVGFPDLNVEVLDLVAEGDRVVARYFDRGTHRGEFFGAKGTGRSYQKHGFAMYRLDDGRIAEIWIQENDHGFLNQLEIALPAGLVQ